MREHNFRLDSYTYENYSKYTITIYKLTQLIEMAYAIHEDEVAQALVDRYRLLEKPKKM